MAITSSDIQNQSFKIERRGYDVDEVDVFLERVASEIDDLNDELEESGWDFTITEGYTYSVDVTFNGDDDEYTETYDVAVLKVDGKWFNSDAMSMITDAATEAYYNS